MSRNTFTQTPVSTSNRTYGGRRWKLIWIPELATPSLRGTSFIRRGRLEPSLERPIKKVQILQCPGSQSIHTYSKRNVFQMPLNAALRGWHCGWNGPYISYIRSAGIYLSVRLDAVFVRDAGQSKTQSALFDHSYD
ncbi:uncharacterized protein M421DRAFT_371393 [Didymella exigua CBS 183.55]|uniref:Uncharacterized protein n=1 Tax=Didymella exigua CBS 183.55 TaxID=1150837 RepID=A0A6A5RPH1_9PLEO|nr:uncharacterized protein M421DRAFT_371393 [Didymella exigua CBS 183.55]KAF1930321.1 hypothetical protein M421DRAFT_371393 [Didymella exigua CBS 183.55]